MARPGPEVPVRVGGAGEWGGGWSARPLVAATAHRGLVEAELQPPPGPEPSAASETGASAASEGSLKARPDALPYPLKAPSRPALKPYPILKVRRRFLPPMDGKACPQAL